VLTILNRLKPYCVAFLLATAALTGAPQVQAETLTNDDVVKLVRAGLADDTISLSIRSAEQVRFDTSANGLAALGKAGVSDQVVQTMISRNSSGAATKAAPAVTNIKPLTPNRRAVQPRGITPVLGKRYYTRANLWHERRKHVTTNYTRGTLLPINSLITLESINQKKMTWQLDSGETLTIALAEKFSQRSLEDIAAELLAAEPVPIESLGKSLARHIAAGELRLGMTREQVLMTRGYPPRHKTPSLDGDRWIYWSSRFVHRTLVFQDGLLAEGRSIR